MSQPPDRRGSRGLAVAAIGQAFGAFMGLALGGRDLGLILAAGLASWGEKWMQDIAAEWTRKGNIVADAALTTSRINGAEQFFGVVIGDPRLIALMQQIAWAAAISGYEPKLQALGAFLGDAVARSDRLDETQLLVSALADIEKPHIAILEILTEAAPDDDKYAAKAAQQAEAARARAANP